MATFLWNGEAFTPETRVALADRGFRYGMMVFETIAAREGRLIFLEEHLARLRAACATTGLSFPEAAGAALPDLPDLPDRGIARIYVTAGPGAIDAPFVSETYFSWEARLDPRPASYRLPDQTEPTLSPWPGLKIGNYWAHARTLTQARKSGFDEALLVHPAGELISAAMANLFAVIDGELTTPALSTGARDGVTRAWVAARRPVRERGFFLAELTAASEIFLTSSGIGIMPVSHLGSRPLPSQHVAQQLRAEFEMGSTGVSPVLPGVPPGRGSGGDAETNTRDACAPQNR